LDSVNKIWRWLKSIVRPSNRDLKIVILCIIGATIIWLLSALNKNYTTVIKCPIELSYASDSTIEVINPPRNVQVNVSGVGWDLLKQSLTFRQDPLLISVENPIETKRIAGYTIQPLISQHLSSLNLNFVVTDTIYFDIQRLRKKKLFVYVDSSKISLQRLHQIVSPLNVSPDSVTITGHESLISTLSDTLSVRLPQDEIDNNYSEKIYIDNFDLSLVSFSPSEIDISFNVSEYVNHSTDLEIQLVNFPMDSSAYIEPGIVLSHFLIQEEMRDNFPDSTFVIIADFNNVNPQDSTVNIEVIEYPDYIQDIKLDTTLFKVRYR
jgi:YbbR domain-containing protein